MRFRITVRGEGVELRGYIDSAVGDGSAALARFAEHMKPNVVLASPAADDYNPFKEEQERELHHFETEQILEAIKVARSNHPECDKHDENDPVTCGWKRAVQDIDAALEKWNG